MLMAPRERVRGEAAGTIPAAGGTIAHAGTATTGTGEFDHAIAGTTRRSAPLDIAAFDIRPAIALRVDAAINAHVHEVLEQPVTSLVALARAGVVAGGRSIPEDVGALHAPCVGRAGPIIGRTVWTDNDRVRGPS